MKILKIITALLAIVALLAGGAFIYQDEESINLTNETRAEFGGTYAKLPTGLVHYEMAGPIDGELVMLVHGFSVPSFLWEPTFNSLIAHGYRVIRFDLYGRGFSDRPDKEYGLELFSAQIGGVLDALNIKQPINLVGLSMGGPIVTRFTHENPEKVKRLILQDPLVHKIGPEVISVLDMPFIGEYFAGVVAVPRMVSLNMNNDNMKKVAGWAEKYHQQTTIIGFRRAILSSLRYMASHQLVDEYKALAKTSMPKLLIWGTEDKTIPISESQTIIDLMPDINFESIEGAGHIPSVEKPAEFNRILLNFLQTS